MIVIDLAVAVNEGLRSECAGVTGVFTHHTVFELFGQYCMTIPKKNAVAVDRLDVARAHGVVGHVDAGVVRISGGFCSSQVNLGGSVRFHRQLPIPLILPRKIANSVLFRTAVWYRRIDQSDFGRICAVYHNLTLIRDSD